MRALPHPLLRPLGLPPFLSHLAVVWSPALGAGDLPIPKLSLALRVPATVSERPALLFLGVIYPSVFEAR